MAQPALESAKKTVNKDVKLRTSSSALFNISALGLHSIQDETGIVPMPGTCVC